MNRETKRMMQRQGQVDADGSQGGGEEPPSQGGGPRPPSDGRGPRPPAPGGRRPAKQRTSPAQFFREIRDELRQVAWPTRAEMINYTAVVFTTLVLMVALIFVLNYAFGKSVLFMFTK